MYLLSHINTIHIYTLTKRDPFLETYSYEHFNVKGLQRKQLMVQEMHITFIKKHVRI